MLDDSDENILAQLPKVQQYVDDIKSGKIASGELIKLAVKRFENDLQRDDLIFVPARVNKVITFISNLKHYTAQFNDKPFILEGWQEWIVANLYGFYWKSGKRRFRSAQISVSKKNGKTMFVAALSMYELICGEPDSKIFLASNSRDQAKVCFEACQMLANKIDTTGKKIKSYRNEVKYKNGSNNQIKVLASESSKLNGVNASFICIDEYAFAPNALVADALKSSSAMRENPLIIYISTNSFDKTNPFYRMRNTNIEVLNSIKTNDSVFAAIYEMDIDGTENKDDWKDPNNWIKSNPNLGVTVQKDFLESEIVEATNDTSTEVSKMTYSFNITCNSSTTWIPSDYIVKATQDIKLEDFIGEECYIGIDLASNCDITALSIMFERGGKYYFFFKFFIPEDSLNTLQAKEQYKLWHREGLLIKTAGNVTDYQYILNVLVDWNDKFIIKKIAYDSWNSTQFNISCTDAGLNQMEAFSGTIGNFSKGTKTFERLALIGDLVIENNEIIRWMISNTFLRMDQNGNVKPSKVNGNSEKKIDGVIAAVSALGTYLNSPHYNITAF